MHAYIMVGPLREDFSTKEMVKAIKSVDADKFRRDLRKYDGVFQKYHSIDLKKGEALYLYGGRDAIARTFAELGDGGAAIMSPTRGPMALFRAQRTAANGHKVKQLVMLTDLVAPLSEALNKRLVVSRFGSSHFTMFKEVLTAVSNLKILS